QFNCSRQIFISSYLTAANEKYTGQALLQKTVSAGGSKIKNDGFMERYLYSDSHETIISDEMFKTAQQEKVRRTNCPDKIIATQEFF
ncbi:MAG: recombinase family protein, partial [Muribaculum sp.]|nr:recombinase family protein [Muribaculum sp.]